MNRQVSIWIAIGTLLVGIAIGRLSVSTRSVFSAPATTHSSVTNQKELAAPPAGNSSAKNLPQTEPVAAVASSGEIYSQLKEALSAGTSRLYDAFTKFSQLIDNNNVRDVLAFAEKIPQKEQREAVTLLVLARWAEFDPKSALTFAQDIPGTQSRVWAISSVLSSWAKLDAAGAVAWAQQIPAGPWRAQPVHRLLSSLSDKG